WLGEAEKSVKAIFSVASKMAPAVVFVDEVDSLLGRRGQWGEHEAMRKVKNEFMSCWDGLRTRAHERVLVLAATNRPFDLDDAIIRRFPRRLMVDLPDADNREKILRVILKDEEVEEGFDYKELAAMTEGYSGSDLKNLCVTAAYQPIKEILKQEEVEKKRMQLEEASKKVDSSTAAAGGEVQPPAASDAFAVASGGSSEGSGGVSEGDAATAAAAAAATTTGESGSLPEKPSQENQHGSAAPAAVAAAPLSSPAAAAAADATSAPADITSAPADVTSAPADVTSATAADKESGKANVQGMQQGVQTVQTGVTGPVEVPTAEAAPAAEEGSEVDVRQGEQKDVVRPVEVEGVPVVSSEVSPQGQAAQSGNGVGGTGMGCSEVGGTGMGCSEVGGTGMGGSEVGGTGMGGSEVGGTGMGGSEVGGKKVLFIEGDEAGGKSCSEAACNGDASSENVCGGEVDGECKEESGTEENERREGKRGDEGVCVKSCENGGGAVMKGEDDLIVAVKEGEGDPCVGEVIIMNGTVPSSALVDGALASDHLMNGVSDTVTAGDVSEEDMICRKDARSGEIESREKEEKEERADVREGGGVAEAAEWQSMEGGVAEQLRIDESQANGGESAAAEAGSDRGNERAARDSMVVGDNTIAGKSEREGVAEGREAATEEPEGEEAGSLAGSRGKEDGGGEKGRSENVEGKEGEAEEAAEEAAKEAAEEAEEEALVRGIVEDILRRGADGSSNASPADLCSDMAAALEMVKEITHEDDTSATDAGERGGSSIKNAREASPCSN
ncbi:unnamed protein product, partial [Closterium sp. NIES-54]